MSPPLSLLEDVLDDVSRVDEFVLDDFSCVDVEEEESPAFRACRRISSAMPSVILDPNTQSCAMKSDR